jgi:hypothetical protein
MSLCEDSLDSLLILCIVILSCSLTFAIDEGEMKQITDGSKKKGEGK